MKLRVVPPPEPPKEDACQAVRSSGLVCELEAALRHAEIAMEQIIDKHTSCTSYIALGSAIAGIRASLFEERSRSHTDGTERRAEKTP